MSIRILHFTALWLPLSVLAMVGCGDSPSQPLPPPPPPIPTGPPSAGPTDKDKLPSDAPVESLTADEYYDLVTKDGQAAAKRFKDKYIELSGEVNGFSSRASPPPPAIIFLAVKGKDGPLEGVRCFTTDKDAQPWSKLAKGQKVKLKGTFPNSPDPSIMQCTIVEPGPATAVVLTSEQLANDFTSGKDAAEKKYQGKGLVVTGEIVNKETAQAGNAYVYLKGNDKLQIRCDFGPHADKMVEPLKGGQKVQLYGLLGERPPDDKAVTLEWCLTITQP